MWVNPPTIVAQAAIILKLFMVVMSTLSNLGWKKILQFQTWLRGAAPKSFISGRKKTAFRDFRLQCFDGVWKRRYVKRRIFDSKTAKDTCRSSGVTLKKKKKMKSARKTHTQYLSTFGAR